MISQLSSFTGRIFQFDIKRMLAPTVVATILLSFSGWAFDRAQELPAPKGKITPAEILDKHLAATGKPEVLQALRTFHAHGSFSFAALQSMGDFHFYYKPPSSDLFELDATSHGQTLVGHNAGAPFANRLGRGLGGVNGVSTTVMERCWLALTEFGFDEGYTRIELVGLADIDGKLAFALRFTPKLGDPQVRYFDCNSFLMVRMDLVERMRLQRDGPESAYKVEAYYSDYRDFSGLNFPRKISANASSSDLVLHLNEIRTNAPIDDSVFQKK